MRGNPQGSLWQSPEWKTYQEALGRGVRVYIGEDGGKIVCSALVVIDRTTGGFSTWDIPRGPLWTSEPAVQELVNHSIEDAKQDSCLALTFSPTKILKLATRNSQLVTSSRHQHPDATILLDLTLADDALLAQMHPKGRYNISVARKHDVEIRPSQDIDAFYELLTQTGSRDAFRVLPKRQYETFLRSLPGAFLLLAYSSSSSRSSSSSSSSSKAIAGLLGIIWGKTGVYYYGASSYAHRALMAPYLLQWEAMRHCRAQGCTTYDLLGIAPENVANHPWAGVTEFKRKFGGTVVNYPPEQQIILKPWITKLLQCKRMLLG